MSRVVNVCPRSDADGVTIFLRIQLGSVKGKLTSQYASVDVADVTEVVGVSYRPFR
jgi:hypothetical protein